MAADIAKLSVKIDANTKGFDEGIASTQKKITEFGAAAKRLGSSGASSALDRVGTGATGAARAFGGLSMSANRGLSAFVGLRGAIAPLITMFAGGLAIHVVTNAIRGAIAAASDLNETVNKSSVVFGGSADVVEAFSKNSAQSLGMSQNAALSAIATFGNLFTTLGVGKDVAARFSMQLAQNAADLASFNNIDPSIVLEKLQAGLVGEAEPLRALGIDVSDAAMKIEALRQGITKSTENMSQAEKVALRYGLVQRQMSNAAGDFARTSTGLANAQRILNAQWADASAKLGGAFLPASQMITASLSQVFPQLLAIAQPALQQLTSTVTNAASNIAYIIGNIPAAIARARQAFGSLPPSVQQLIPALAMLVPILLGLGAAIVGVGTVLPLLNFGALLNPIGLVIAALAGLFVAYQTNFLGIRSLVDSAIPGIVNAIIDGLGGIIDALAPVFDGIGGAFVTFFQWGEGLWSTYGANILAIFEGALGFLMNNAKVYLTSMAKIFQAGLDFINGDWQMGWIQIQKATNDIWKLMVTNAGKAVNAIVGIFRDWMIKMAEGYEAQARGPGWAEMMNNARAMRAGAAIMGDLTKSVDLTTSSVANLTHTVLGFPDWDKTMGLGSTNEELLKVGANTGKAAAQLRGYLAALKAWYTRPNLPSGGPDDPGKYSESRPTPPLPPIATAAGAGGGGAKAAAQNVRDLVSALVAVHPATLAAAAAVKMWETNIASVNLAIKANQDQLKAAQAELGRMQERLQELQRELDIAKRKLTEFSQPRLTGMGEMEMQISAIGEQLKRVQLAKSLGVPLDSIISRFPRLTAGAENYLGTLPTTEQGLQKVLDQLTLMQSLSFDEKMRLLGQAAADAVPEMSYETAMAGTVQWKAQVDALTLSIAAQEAAIRAQEKVIKDIQAAGDALNNTLEFYQTQLQQAKTNQDAVTNGLTMAYTWLLQDRQAMIDLGGTAATMVPLIDAQMAALLMGFDKFATGEAGLVQGGIVALYDTSKAKLDEINALVASLNTTVVTTHIINTIRQTNGIPEMAAGGPVYAGQAYIVGENRPEVFVPDRDGTILPNTSRMNVAGGAGRSGGGNTYITVQLAVEGNVQTENDLVAAVHTGLAKVAKRNGGTGLKL